MAHVTRRLPAQPHLDIPKREARELQKQVRAGDNSAVERIRRLHPKFRSTDGMAPAPATFRLSDAQLVIAREYGFASWPELKMRIEANPAVGALRSAISADDLDGVIRLAKAHPALLHIPLVSDNWGPPMSHAANLGRLNLVQALAALGARDFQHAFDRAVLQGKLDCARWLHGHGAQLLPGIVMGPCETLNADGLRFLAELGAPFSDRHGNTLAPLGMVLETYSRWPEGKHACLDLLAERGSSIPNTPMMAFHRGQVNRLAEHLDRDPALLHRRFTYREIYPPELGCHDDGHSGLHGTPIGGTTFLHLAIDFDEPEIFELLLTRGSDVNARAAPDAEGFGGHTPLFHAVVGSQHRGVEIARRLLERGAAIAIRANLRKFLDWTEVPAWHVAQRVTAVEWGRGFPEKSWVNVSAIELLERQG